jgi:hypothetical protein
VVRYAAAVFTAEEREGVRARLLDWARADSRIAGAAITGSGAHGGEDDWSDIDLVFGIEGIDPIRVLADWTDRLHGEFDAIELFDLRSGATIYRVFLLPNGLEIDLAVAPAAEFGPLGPNFRAVFGEVVERHRQPRPSASHLIGLGCHHVLHARACIERGKVWQAEHVIHALREHIVALACVRLGLESFFGRELDLLPPGVTVPLQGALVTSIETGELRRALSAAIQCLLVEIRTAEPGLAAKLEAVLREADSFR